MDSIAVSNGLSVPLVMTIVNFTARTTPCDTAYLPGSHGTGAATSTAKPSFHVYRLPHVGDSAAAGAWAAAGLSVPLLLTWPWLVVPSNRASSSSTAFFCTDTVIATPATHTATPMIARTFLLPKTAITPRMMPTPATTAVRLFRMMIGDPTTPTIPRMSAVQASAPNFVFAGGAGGVGYGACGCG